MAVALAAAVLALCLDIRWRGEASPLEAAALVILLVTLAAVTLAAFGRQPGSEASDSGMSRDNALSLIEGIAQELRTLVGTVSGFSELLNSPAAAGLSPEETQSYRRFIADGCETLNTVSLQLLDYVRLERRQLRLLEQHTDAAELVEATLKACAEAAERADVTVLARLVEGIELRCDLGRAGQALKSILLFAVSGTPAGGTVMVDFASGPEGDLAITVSARGQRLTGEEIGRLFLPDVRQRGVPAMSLAVARGVLRLHGGDVRVSDSENSGTLYCLHLPGSRVTWPFEQRKEPSNQSLQRSLLAYGN